MKNENLKKTKAAHRAADQPDLLAQIEKRAFELWEAGGCRHGKDLEHWFQAQRELLGQANGRRVTDKGN
jgi:hypothetical protein